MSKTTRYDFTNCSPRSVITIGKVATIPLSYELTMNSLLESDVATIVVPLDLIDFTTEFENYRQQNTYLPIEIWSGWIDINNEYSSFNEAMLNYPSNDELKRHLVNNENYKKVMDRRWFGMMDIPSFSWSKRNGDFLTLTCKEVITLLDDFTFEKKYEEGQATVKAIIDELASKLSDFKISIDKDLLSNTIKMNLQMGQKAKINKDDGSEEQIDHGYNTTGKTFFQVIKDLCLKAKIDFVQSDTDPFTYIFKEPMTSDTLWTLDRRLHFDEVHINGGKFGHTNGASKVGVIVKSVGKDGTVIDGKFPRNLDNDKPESRKIKIITDNSLTTKEQCQEKASQYALNYGKYSITGRMNIPNAITGIKPDHLLRLKDTTPLSGYSSNRKLDKITKDILFRINSIQEVYSQATGLSQPSVEFELDIMSNLNVIDTNTGKINGLSNFAKANELEEQNSNEMISYEKLYDSDKLKDIRDRVE